MNTLYIISGAPGAGKTTYGRALAKELNATLLDIDTVTEKLVQTALKALGKDPDDRDSPFFKQTFRNPIYETLFETAAENLSSTPVVITGPFTSEKRNPNWTDELEARFQTKVEIR
ncbi:MAG: AAA family ATPase, partial [Verrucomicrobiota bacterium]